MTDARRVIAVIGGGAAGAMTAIACSRDPRLAATHRIVVFDPSPRPARGTAYTTVDHQHLLNTPARQMSAVAGDEDHFVRWLRLRHPGISGDEFRPRMEYGDYLAECLTAAVMAARVTVERRIVTDVRRSAGGVTVEHSGGVLTADSAVLALGHAPPRSIDVELADGDPRRYVADPWASGAIGRLIAATRPGQRIVLVGSGLTAVDVALTLTATGRNVICVSRSGWWPRAHRLPLPEPAPFVLDPGQEPRLAADLERFVLDHVARSVAGGHDWRAAMDGLRPVTTQLWRALPLDEQRRLLADAARRWEIHRHRMAPTVARRIAALRRSGRLSLVTGTLASARLAALTGEVEVRSSGGSRRLPAAGLVNCTGSTCDLRRYPGPLGARLLDAGTACRHPTGLGIVTTGDGAVVDANGRADARLLAVGLLRRGELYESTAIPEIRAQAATAADVLSSASLPVPSLGAGMVTAPYGQNVRFGDTGRLKQAR